MIDEAEAATRVVCALNSAFRADPGAVHALVCNRVPCNQALADDPLVQVAESTALPGTFTVGLIGLLNGVLSAAGLPLVATQWRDSEKEGEPATFLGFARYSPP